MTWLLGGGAVIGVVILLWLVVRFAKKAGYQSSKLDAQDEIIGDVTDAKEARDRLTDPDEYERLRREHTRK